MSSKFSQGARAKQHPSICLKPPPGRAAAVAAIQFAECPPPPPPPEPHAPGYFVRALGALGEPPNALTVENEVALTGDFADPQNWLFDTWQPGQWPFYHAEVTREKISYFPEVWGDFVQLTFLFGGIECIIVQATEADSDPTEIYRHYAAVQGGPYGFNGDITFTFYPEP